MDEFEVLGRCGETGHTLEEWFAALEQPQTVEEYERRFTPVKEPHHTRVVDLEATPPRELGTIEEELA
jgi:hypothetical protein